MKLSLNFSHETLETQRFVTKVDEDTAWAVYFMQSEGFLVVVDIGWMRTVNATFLLF